MQSKINEVNDFREQAQQILNKSQQVRRQQDRVKSMLAQEEDFNLSAYSRWLQRTAHCGVKRYPLFLSVHLSI